MLTGLNSWKENLQERNKNSSDSLLAVLTCQFCTHVDYFNITRLKLIRNVLGLSESCWLTCVDYSVTRPLNLTANRQRNVMLGFLIETTSRQKNESSH